MLKRTLLGAAALLALGACSEKTSAPAEAAPATGAEAPAETAAASAPTPEAATIAQECGAVTASGYCGLTWGMTADAAAAAFPGGLVGEPMDQDEAACFYKRRADTDYGALFMFLDGALARVDVQSADIQSEAGATVGMAFDAVEALYPGSKRQPNHYTAPLEDLIVDLGQGAFAVFEQEDGVVSHWRIGVKPAVDFIEGCS